MSLKTILAKKRFHKFCTELGVLTSFIDFLIGPLSTGKLKATGMLLHSFAYTIIANNQLMRTSHVSIMV